MLVTFEGNDLTRASLEKLCEELRKTNSPNNLQDFLGIYVKVPIGNAKKLVDKARSQMPDKRPQYNLEDNHCMSFAIEMAEVAGVDVRAARNVSGYEVTEQDKQKVRDEVERFDFTEAHYKFIRDEAIKENALARFVPESMLRGQLRAGVADGYIKALEEAIPKMQPPSLMILALQEIWEILNYAPMVFREFPQAVFLRKRG